ncbi:MAG: hypothetical protein ABIB47_06450 [Candidatus Woesearchaeota archaeon]
MKHLFGENPSDYYKPNLKICWQKDRLSSSKMQAQSRDASPKYRSVYLSFDDTAPNIKKTVQIADINNDGVPDVIEMLTKQDFPDPSNPKVTKGSNYTINGIYVNPQNLEAIKAITSFHQEFHRLTDQELKQLTKDYQALLRLGTP